MVELRKARATDTPVCECIICCLVVSEWLYEMVVDVWRFFFNVRKSAKLRAMHPDPKSAEGPYWCQMAELIIAQATGTPDWVLV